MNLAQEYDADFDIEGLAGGPWVLDFVSSDIDYVTHETVTRKRYTNATGKKHIIEHRTPLAVAVTPGAVALGGASTSNPVPETGGKKKKKGLLKRLMGSAD